MRRLMLGAFAAVMTSCASDLAGVKGADVRTAATHNEGRGDTRFSKLAIYGARICAEQYARAHVCFVNVREVPGVAIEAWRKQIVVDGNVIFEFTENDWQFFCDDEKCSLVNAKVVGFDAVAILADVQTSRTP